MKIIVEMDQVPKGKTTLYVGNLSPKVNENILQEIFAVSGPIASVKIINDVNYAHGSLKYGFVEYKDVSSAETALQTMNGRRIFENEIKVNWAHQTSGSDTMSQFHLFVGDLAPDVNDADLAQAFASFPSRTESRVMWDHNTNRSRGYGFVSFKDRTDAEKAIATMNGEYIGSRPVRVNWANQKSQHQAGTNTLVPGMGGGTFAPNPNYKFGIQNYEIILQQAQPYNTTVYVGNLTAYTTQNDLIPLFQPFGYIVEIRMSADRGFSFVKMDSHEAAAMAICNLQGYSINGRPIKCGWGKDKPADATGTQGSVAPGNTAPSQFGAGFFGQQQPFAYDSYLSTYGNNQAFTAGPQGAYSYYAQQLQPPHGAQSQAGNSSQ